MPGKGVDGVAQHGLLSGGRLRVRGVESPLLDFAQFVERADVFHIALPDRPVDKRHAHRDADDHADRRHRVAEVASLGPPQRGERLGEAAHRAMAALKADFEQVAERGMHAEAGREHEDGKRQPHHVHAPRDDLGEAELLGDGAPRVADVREAPADEHRGKDDVDQKPRNRLPPLVPFGRHMTPCACQDDQPKRAAHNGRGQVELSEERKGRADGLAADEQKAQCAERGDGGHGWNISV